MLRLAPQRLSSLAQLTIEDSSGVMLLPMVCDSSDIAFMPALKVRPDGRFSGREVWMSTVAPMPPLGACARPVLKTVMPLTASEASWAKLKPRVPAPTPPVMTSPLE